MRRSAYVGIDSDVPAIASSTRTLVRGRCRSYCTGSRRKTIQRPPPSEEGEKAARGGLGAGRTLGRRPSRRLANYRSTRPEESRNAALPQLPANGTGPSIAGTCGSGSTTGTMPLLPSPPTLHGPPTAPSASSEEQLARGRPRCLVHTAQGAPNVLVRIGLRIVRQKKTKEEVEV